MKNLMASNLIAMASKDAANKIGGHGEIAKPLSLTAWWTDYVCGRMTFCRILPLCLADCFEMCVVFVHFETNL